MKITFETNKDVVYPEWSVVKASYNAGDKKVKNLSKNNIYLAKTTKQNNFGILTNAANMYRKFAKADGISEPQNLKFWAGSGMVGGLTLMQDVVTADLASIGSAIGSIGGTPWAVAGAVAGGLIGSYFPDIMISTRAENMTQTESITEYVFHEMAHASHYTGIGLGNVTYWNLEYIKMLGGWVEVLANGSSPLQDCYNGGKSKQVCLIESWGYFYGYYLMNKYYGENRTQYDYVAYLDGTYNRLPYFFHTVYYRLNKKIPINQIFEPYKYFSVQSVETWYSKLVELNKGIDSSGEIKKAFKEKGIAL